MITGLRAGAHACVVTNLNIFIAVTAAFGAVGIIYGLIMHVQMRREWRRHDEEMAQHPMGRSDMPGGWTPHAGWPK